MSTLAVALSGGVDSAVAAARLCAAGQRPVGVTARLLPAHYAGARGCCDEQLARELCAHLGMEHYVVDLSEAFERDIISRFVWGYGAGLTPNPCLPCNQVIKFGLLLEAVRDIGCDTLATGHYAVAEPRAAQEGRVRWGIRRGADLTKDQSYMLLGLSQEQIARARFPLGGALKAEVIAEAKRLALPHTLRESQDVCFLPGELKDFLGERLAMEPGAIIDTSGRQLGTHQGLPLYTIGQRRGLEIGGRPRLYVLAKDVARNALIVGDRRELFVREFMVTGTNWISAPPPPDGAVLRCAVVVRYRATPIAGEVTVLSEGECRVTLARHQQAVAPGQGAAFYDEEGWLLGGGTITR